MKIEFDTKPVEWKRVPLWVALPLAISAILIYYGLLFGALVGLFAIASR